MSAESTRVEILQAASDVLAAEGFEGFTTAAVAERADVSQGLVHHYFDTKADLLRELFEWGWDNARQHVDERTDGDDPRDRLLTFAGYLLTPEEEYENRLAVARIDLELRALAMHDDSLRRVFEQGRSEAQDLVASILQDGIESGRFRPVDVERWSALVLTLVTGAEQRFAIHGNADASQPILDGFEQLVDEWLVVPDRAATAGSDG